MSDGSTVTPTGPRNRAAGRQHGYTHVKGLPAQLATISTGQAAPVIG